jgi:hypothetical protein
MKLSGQARRDAACEACLVLNRTVNEVLLPLKIVELYERIFTETTGRIACDIIKSSKIAEILFAIQEHRGMLDIALTACVLSVYRLRETRDHLIVDWLFTDAETTALGLPPLQNFMGGEKEWASASLEIIRHNMAGHSMIRKGTKFRPGRIVPAQVLGKATRQTGLSDCKAFIARVREKLMPGVMKFGDELRNEYPEIKDYMHYYQTEYDVFENQARDD